MIKNAKNTVTFIATQYKSKPVNISFYTKDGDKVKFTATEKVPAKERVQFRKGRGPVPLVSGIV